MQIDKIRPQALEMEQCVLGAMLIDPSAIEIATQILRPEDFFRQAHQFIFHAIQILTERSVPIDLYTVQEQLKNLPIYGNVLEDAGGMPYLVVLTDIVPSPSQIGYYARLVANAVILRNLVDAGSQIVSLGSNALNDFSFESIEDVIGSAETALAKVMEGSLDREATRGEIGGDELPDAADLESLWFGLYPSRATLLNGETGAGKSSLLYNVCLQAARNQSLWGVPFEKNRPLQILYLDPENAGEYRDVAHRDGGMCRRKLDNILEAGGRIPPTLRFMDAQGLDLSSAAHIRRLEYRIRRGWRNAPFDILVLDPIITLFHIREENSNAEMNAVGDSVRLLARRTGACVIATHHTGKSLTTGVMSGRGGSGLPGPFDVVMTLRTQGRREDEQDEEYLGEMRVRQDVCRLRIEKDRPARFGQGASLYLRMGSPRLDCFERVPFADWKEARRAENEQSGTRASRAKPLIRELLSDNDFHSRTEIHREIGKLGNQEIGKNNLDAALREMADAGEIESARMGGALLAYRLKPEPIKEEEDPYAG